MTSSWFSQLDATFSVGRDVDTEFILVESQGPDRNVDYLEGLETLLYGLADRDAYVDEILIDSTETRRLPLVQRRLVLRLHTYPVRLRLHHVGKLRRDITATAAATASARTSSGGGNPTKRLRIALRQSDPLTLFKLTQLLAQGVSPRTAHRRGFSFTPSSPSANSTTGARRAVDETEVTHLHAKMQSALYQELIGAWGPENVACEALVESGRPADIILKNESNYELFEIKTALAPRDCVRQALGQLLEYAYWPTSPPFDLLWVVGPSLLDKETEAFIDGLRRRFGIPLKYRQQPEAAGPIDGPINVDNTE